MEIYIAPDQVRFLHFTYIYIYMMMMESHVEVDA